LTYSTELLIFSQFYFAIFTFLLKVFLYSNIITSTTTSQYFKSSKPKSFFSRVMALP